MIWALTIIGQFEEPFLEAALRSVDWVDGYAVVNTDPEGKWGQHNEAAVRNTVPRDKLLLGRLWMSQARFDFAKARNTALQMIPVGDAVLILDADDVHWPGFQGLAKNALAEGYDYIGAHYWHHAVAKNLWHSQPHRYILFVRTTESQWVNTQGTVHEELFHPKTKQLILPDYRYHHYGYIKPARDVARRWEFYRSLGAPIHDYDRTQPDRALDDWPRICNIYTGEHPPAVRKTLGQAYTPDGSPDTTPVWVWPDATPDMFPHDTHKARVGLVLLTWNDAENLRSCLASLAFTHEPFELTVVDNGSEDNSLDLLGELLGPGQTKRVFSTPEDERGQPRNLSLVQALNMGFGHFVDRQDLDYVGWIHPDHVFEYPDWLTELVQAMDGRPDWAKLGCQETSDAGAGLREGNSQCFIIRRTALKEIGLFDDAYLACGGYEDWDMNRRLINNGYKVMIWPNAVVRHNAMSTRSRHDNEEAAKRNAGYYQEKWGDAKPPC